MNHLRTGVRLLLIVRDSNRVELTNRIVSLEYTTRVLPCDRRSGLNLRPRNLGIIAGTHPSLRYEARIVRWQKFQDLVDAG